MDTRPYFFASRAFQRQKRGTGDEARQYKQAAVMLPAEVLRIMKLSRSTCGVAAWQWESDAPHMRGHLIEQKRRPCQE